MRAALCTAFGPPETLRIDDLPDPVAGPGQVVLVRYGDGPKGLMAAEVRPDTGSGNSSH